MLLDGSKVISLGIVLCGIQRSFAEDEVTSCSSALVAVGERGEMVFHLAPHIVQTADRLYMYIRKDGEPDALSCHKTGETSPFECDTPNRHFWSEGVVGRKLTLVAHKVTRDVEGVYVLRVYVNGTIDHSTSCSFIILEHKASNGKDSSSVVPIVISVILVAVIVVVVGVVVFRYRKGAKCQSIATYRRGKHFQDAAEDTTATAHAGSDNTTAPSEDAPFIETSVSIETQTPLSPIVPTKSDDSKATGFRGGELRLLLVGTIGAGKSASGNTISGRETFESLADWGQVSTQCDLKQAVRHNILIKVTDTPGLCRTTLSEKELDKELVKGLATVAPGPHAILLVLRSDTRLTTDDYTAYTSLKQFLGEKMTEFMIVIFTGLDHYDKDFDEELRVMPDLRQFLDDARRRYIGFNNRLPMSERVLQGDRLIELVVNMTNPNCGRYYTSDQIDKCERIIQAEMKKGKSRDMIKEAIVKDSEPALTKALLSASSSDCSLM